MPRIRKRSKGGWLAADAAAAACTRCWQKNSISGVIALEWNDDLVQGMCRVGVESREYGLVALFMYHVHSANTMHHHALQPLSHLGHSRKLT